MKDFWADRLNISCGGYNTSIDETIYKIIKLLIDGHKSDDYLFVDDLARILNIDQNYAELILYILASVPDMFNYGTSPRGLFVNDLAKCEQFLKEFREYIDHA